MTKRKEPCIPNTTCAMCQKPLYRSTRDLERATLHYCSPQCKSSHLSELRRDESTRLQLVCENCHQPFSRPRAWVRSEEQTRFCSKGCRTSHLAKTSIRKIDSMGYVKIRVNGQWIHEHRIVMEHKLGRALTDNDIVHHLDHNKTNNLPENLELMHRPDHQRMHYKERFPLGVGEWGAGRLACISCGLTESPYKAQGMCQRCYRRQRTLKQNPQAKQRLRR